MNLMIVESPTKISKIQSILGDKWVVKASVGHIYDLSLDGGDTGIGIENYDNYKGIYQIMKDKKRVVNDIKAKIAICDEVYIATDPDREGEGIAKHLVEALKLKDYKRITFNEISAKAITEAINKTRKIDNNMAEAQDARRLLDRIFGFKGSQAITQVDPLCKSIGRVQTPALSIVHQRNEEIKNFVPKEYKYKELNYHGVKFRPTFLTDGETSWTIGTKDGPNTIKITDLNEEHTKFFNNTDNKAITVKSIEKRTVSSNPYQPLITTTAMKLLMKSMGINETAAQKTLQKLFDHGLVTYIRTDSPVFSQDAIYEGLAYLKSNNMEHLANDAYTNPKAKKNAQEAHEGIRPVHFRNTQPTELVGPLMDAYKLIHRHSILALCNPCIEDVTTVALEQGDDLNKVCYKGSTSAIVEYGYKELLEEDFNDGPKFNINEGDVIDQNDVTEEYMIKTTSPKSYFNKITFIEAIEKAGIARPSTMAPTVSGLFKRQYLEEVDKKIMVTHIGEKIINICNKHIPEFIDIDYTKRLEEDLDAILHGEKNKIAILSAFTDSFIDKLSGFSKVTKSAVNKLKKQNKATGKKCPKCKADLVIRTSTYGEFTGCSAYPKCKYIEKKKK